MGNDEVTEGESKTAPGGFAWFSGPAPEACLHDSLSPSPVFGWGMATTDVILRREGERYDAILKNRRYPRLEWPTGKTIRFSNAFGPQGWMCRAIASAR